MQPPINSGQKKVQIIVDEGSHPLVEQFRKFANPDPAAEWILIAEKHSGIPDAEILSRLLNHHTILLTCDRVLHNQACRLGYRSYTRDEKGQLRRHELRQFPTPAPLPVPNRELQSDYSHPPN